MSGKRVLAVYAALLLGFAVVLCRLYLLALHPAYAARAAAQSTVTLQLPARRGNFYDAQGRLLTGLEKRWQVVCFPGQGNYDRLYACADAAGQALLYRSRSRAAPFLLEVSCDPARLGLTGYPAARRYAAVPLCQHLLGYLDGTGHGAAGLEKALDTVLSGTGENSSLVCAVTAQGTLRTGETARLLQADSGALGVQLTISRPVQRAVEAVAASTMTSGCILVLDTATAAVRASVSVPCYDPENLADSLQAENSPFLNRALQSYAVGSVFKPVLAAAALEAGLQPVFECTGAVVVDGQIFRCAGGVPHGQVDLAAALEKSCNGYFIRLGQQLGAESLLDAAKAFGFGQSLPLAEGLAAEAGQLELNVMEPIIAFTLFTGIRRLARAFSTLQERCVAGITANADRCRQLVENSIGIVTALNTRLGYETSAGIAREALESGRSIMDLVLEKQLLTRKELDELLLPENMIHPFLK